MSKLAPIGDIASRVLWIFLRCLLFGVPNFYLAFSSALIPVAHHEEALKSIFLIMLILPTVLVFFAFTFFALKADYLSESTQMVGYFLIPLSIIATYAVYLIATIFNKQ